MMLADDADPARLILGALPSLELDAMTPDAMLLLDTILAAVTEVSLPRPSGDRGRCKQYERVLQGRFKL